MAREKVVLAYSGGLDTSVAVKWINETYNMDVIAYTCDLGQGQDIEAIRQKALRTGAIDAFAEDAHNLFVDYFVFPSLAAGAFMKASTRWRLRWAARSSRSSWCALRATMVPRRSRMAARARAMIRSDST